MNRAHLTEIAIYVLHDAATAYHWHQAKVRPAKTPRMPLSVATDILRTARNIGLPDLRNGPAFDRFMRDHDERVTE